MHLKMHMSRSHQARAMQEQHPELDANSLVVSSPVVLQVSILDSSIAHYSSALIQLLVADCPPLLDGARALGLGFIQ